MLTGGCACNAAAQCDCPVFHFYYPFLPQRVLWNIPSLFGNPVARSETDQWLCELVTLQPIAFIGAYSIDVFCVTYPCFCTFLFQIIIMVTIVNHSPILCNDLHNECDGVHILCCCFWVGFRIGPEIYSITGLYYFYAWRTRYVNNQRIIIHSPFLFL